MPGGNLNEDGIADTFVLVILLQFLPYPVHFDANDGVNLGVIAIAAPEYIYANRIFFKMCESSFSGFRRYIL